MKKLTLMLSLLLVALLATSCKKDKKEDPQPGRKEMLCQLWKVDQVLLNGTPKTDTDYSAHRFRFDPDGTYRVTTATTNDQGTWEFSSNEQSIIMDKGETYEDEAEILSLTATNLDLEFTSTSSKNGTQTIVFKLKK